ncbi:MAG: peptide chain release factor N(5)-glutamine methyltransferase, partial [Salinibacter sp.]
MTDSHGTDPSGSSASSPTQLGLLDRAARRLEAADRTAPRRTAEWLLAEVVGADRAHLYARPDRPVAPEVARQFEEMVERRADGEPLQHILGYASFHGLRIQVSPAVMVPRPETEIVVDRALACIENTDAPRVLDAGTGSGCIALALKHERPDAAVSACDVSADALAVARTNAESLGLDVQFLAADVLAEGVPDAVPGCLDVLVANPPYIPDDEADLLPPVVREYDPDVSLFAGDDPLRFYRALLDWTQVLCVPGGAVVFEVHADYADAVEALLRRKGLAEVGSEEDLSGRPRGVWGRVPDVPEQGLTRASENAPRGSAGMNLA